jgi:hypothetical protein
MYMDKAEKLKNARNILLKLHKSMIDIEREMYEGLNGPVTPAQFVTLLMEDDDFGWLRKFSSLIVEIDEMFASKDGVDDALVDASLQKVTGLANMSEPDDYFRNKYQYALQHSPDSAGLHSQLKKALTS